MAKRHARDRRDSVENVGEKVGSEKMVIHIYRSPNLQIIYKAKGAIGGVLRNDILQNKRCDNWRQQYSILHCRHSIQ